jgi:hypothetical protein
MTMLSPLAAAVAELAAAAGVQSIVGVDAAGVRRIRPVEPGPGDALGPGKYQAFVVVSQLGAPWATGTATSSVTLGLRCYAATHALAEALALACAAVFHRAGPRVAASGLAIYGSTVQGGPQPDKDPDTRQPLAHLIVGLNTSVQAVTSTTA